MTTHQVIPLLADEFTHASRCRRCKRPLTDTASLGYGIGPVCRHRMGITQPHPTRQAPTRRGGHIPGQADLLNPDEHSPANDPTQPAAT